jgi:hypothetical protein
MAVIECSCQVGVADRWTQAGIQIFLNAYGG